MDSQLDEDVVHAAVDESRASDLYLDTVSMLGYPIKFNCLRFIVRSTVQSLISTLRKSAPSLCPTSIFTVVSSVESISREEVPHRTRTPTPSMTITTYSSTLKLQRYNHHQHSFGPLLIALWLRS